MHHVPFRQKTIVIGRNNAGKTSIVEALRLLSIVVTRFRSLNIVDMSSETGLQALNGCVAPSLRGTNVDLLHVCHQYGEPPAVIEAYFDEGFQVEIYLFPDNQLFGVIKDDQGRRYRHRSQARHFRISPINVLPQVRPLLTDEEVRDPNYVRSSMTTDLAPLHFRNQLRNFESYYDAFVYLAETTWPGLRVRGLSVERSEGGKPILVLLVQDGPFVAEVGRMGHGLQIWLQAIWFLARSERDQTLILDEPDVYLHADLQRRLARQLVMLPNQVITTTHAVDVLSEVAPEQILIVEKTQPTSSFATSVPAVQAIIDHIGSIHNIQLARLWNARRLLLVEGKDVYLLRCFQDVLYPEAAGPIDAIPNMPIGGWGGWNYAVGTSMLLKNAIDEGIIAYCILDSDHRSEDEKEERRVDARNRNVQLHIWDRKEIENYLLNPDVIARAANTYNRTGKTVTSEKVKSNIENIAERLKDEVIDALVERRIQQDRRLSYKAVIGPVREELASRWDAFESKMEIVPGKRVLARLFGRLQTEYKVSLTPGRIARAFRREEMPDELKQVLRSIEEGAPFLS